MFVFDELKMEAHSVASSRPSLSHVARIIAATSLAVVAVIVMINTFAMIDEVAQMN